MHRNNKSSLFLMEMLFSIFIFAVAAAICVKMFVTSHILSRDSVRLNHAVVWCESMAEGFYSVDGDLADLAKLLDASVEDRQLTIYYDRDFLKTGEADNAYYTVQGNLRSEEMMEYLDIVCLCKEDNNEVYTISCGIFPEGTDSEE